VAGLPGIMRDQGTSAQTCLAICETSRRAASLICFQRDTRVGTCAARRAALSLLLSLTLAPRAEEEQKRYTEGSRSACGAGGEFSSWCSSFPHGVSPEWVVAEVAVESLGHLRRLECGGRAAMVASLA